MDSLIDLGLYCAEMKRLNPIKRTVESVCKSYIDLLHVENITETTYHKKTAEPQPEEPPTEEIDIERETALLRGLTLNQTIAREAELKVKQHSCTAVSPR